MPVPTIESFAMPPADEMLFAPIFLSAALTSFTAALRSDSATEKVRSVCPERPMFCTMTSTEMPALPSGSKIAAATPGRSATPSTVILATLVSCAIPRTRCLSSIGTWATIIVPTPSWKLERTWIGTPYSSPISTARGCITRAPTAASSSISSYRM